MSDTATTAMPVMPVPCAGEKLKALWRARGTTETQIAAASTISRPHLSQVLNGKRPLSAATRKRLERVLDYREIEVLEAAFGKPG